VSALLFFAFVGVYVLGVAGVVVAGTIVEPRPDDSHGLEDRLVLARETTAPHGTIIARHPRYSRHQPGKHHRADAARSLHGAIESVTRAFTPVVTRRMRSDVATSGSLRSARSH
jgi:hypothetical protein